MNKHTKLAVPLLLLHNCGPSCTGKRWQGLPLEGLRIALKAEGKSLSLAAALLADHVLNKHFEVSQELWTEVVDLDVFVILTLQVAVRLESCNRFSSPAVLPCDLNPNCHKPGKTNIIKCHHVY